MESESINAEQVKTLIDQLEVLTDATRAQAAATIAAALVATQTSPDQDSAVGAYKGIYQALFASS